MKSCEATVWQVFGIATWTVGAFLLGASIYTNGLGHASPNVLFGAVGSAVLMVVGAASLVTGRVLTALARGCKSREAQLWRVLSAVCCLGGALPITSAYCDIYHNFPTLNDLAMAMAGSFQILAGVTILLGQRVMDHVALHPQASRAQAAPPQDAVLDAALNQL
jgi:hypothetical protein